MILREEFICILEKISGQEHSSFNPTVSEGHVLICCGPCGDNLSYLKGKMVVLQQRIEGSKC